MNRYWQQRDVSERLSSARSYRKDTAKDREPKAMGFCVTADGKSKI